MLELRSQIGGSRMFTRDIYMFFRHHPVGAIMSRHSLCRRLFVALIAVGITLSSSIVANAQESGPVAPDSIARGHRWAVNDLMRLYEAIRLAAKLETRERLVKRMRVIMDEWVNPLERTTSSHYKGENFSRCDASSSMEDTGCVARDIALAHVYFGLAKRAIGHTGAEEEELACAAGVFKAINEAKLYIRRPPEFKYEVGTDLMRVPEVLLTVGEAIEDEKSKWPKEERSAVRISYVVLPEPSVAERETRWNEGPRFADLETYPVIETSNVEDKERDFFARVASEDLRRTLKRLYTYENLGSDDPSVCPDPRAVYLPVGEYVLYSSASRSFPQPFTVETDGNSFILEHFAAGTSGTKEGAGEYKAAWYRVPELQHEDIRASGEEVPAEN